METRNIIKSYKAWIKKKLEKPQGRWWYAKRKKKLIITGCCFLCGKMAVRRMKPMTKHHCIPKRMKPRMNVIIPLCRGCHDELENNYCRYSKRGHK